MRSAQFARLYAGWRTGRVRAGAARIHETDFVATAALSGRGAAEGSGTHTFVLNSIVIELRTHTARSIVVRPQPGAGRAPAADSRTGRVRGGAARIRETDGCGDRCPQRSRCR